MGRGAAGARLGGERESGGAGVFQQIAVAQKITEAQVGDSRLFRPEELTRAAQLEIAARDFEAVIRVDQDLESRARLVRRPLPREEDAVRPSCAV